MAKKAAKKAKLLSPEVLEKNATIINAEHQKVIQANQDVLEHAIEAGSVLQGSKKGMEHGKWLAWLETNCSDVSDRTANVYMLLAKYSSAINAATAEHEANPQHAADFSIRWALGVIKEARKAEQAENEAKLTEEQKAKREAKRKEREGKRATDKRHKELTYLRGVVEATTPDALFMVLKATFDRKGLEKLVVQISDHIKQQQPTTMPPSTQLPQAERRV
jgi:hypothetical protein